MRFVWIFLIFISQKVDATQVRVRLLTEQNSIHLTVEEFKIISNSHRCLRAGVKIKSRRAELIIKRSLSGWGLFNVANRQLCEIESQKIKFQARAISINHHLVPHEIVLEPVTSKRGFDVIADLDLEKYLIGVLSKEMPASFPLEAFKAQAIASRSYAMKKIISSGSRDFDLESGVADQVFEYSSGSARVLAAVEETRGLVLENQKGRLFPVYYHADCGGHTEEPSDVWGSNERNGTVVDESCPLEPRSSWRFAISKFELTARLRVVLQLGDAQISGIEEFENSSSGRKKSLKFVLDDHTTRLISGQQLRNILGYEKLKSTLFAFNQSGSDFIFEGKGHGHGVGMCQWGARHLALGGFDYPRILKHYYPLAKLAEIPEVAATSGESKLE